jgi:head-tail adaptor
MTAREQITVYTIVQTDDGYGGTTEALEVMHLAPTWANIKVNNQSQVSFGAYQPATDFTLEVNYKHGFTWQPEMVISSALYGFMKVDNAFETIRLRNVRVNANRLDRDIWLSV